MFPNYKDVLISLLTKTGYATNSYVTISELAQTRRFARSHEAMGAKRKAPPVSPVEKKAKVELTEEQIALEKLLTAFDGPVGTMLSPNVVAMVKEIA